MLRPFDLVLLVLGRVDGYAHTAGQVATFAECVWIVGLERASGGIQTGLDLERNPNNQLSVRLSTESSTRETFREPSL